MDSIAGCFLAYIFSLSICETGECVGDVDTADVGW